MHSTLHSLMNWNSVLLFNSVVSFVYKVFNFLYVLLEEKANKAAHALARESIVFPRPFIFTLPPSGIEGVLLTGFS